MDNELADSLRPAEEEATWPRYGWQKWHDLALPARLSSEREDVGRWYITTLSSRSSVA